VVLPDIDGKTTFPVNSDDSGAYWVPTHTTAVHATAVADTPVEASAGPWLGAEFLGTPGAGGSVTITGAADQLTSGHWTVSASSPGPFTGTAAPKGTARATLTATTQPVDPAAHASTGAFWDYGGKHEPVAVAAGGTGTMTLTLAPTAAVGTVVHGILYVDTRSVDDYANGSEIIGIPYTYTVG